MVRIQSWLPFLSTTYATRPHSVWVPKRSNNRSKLTLARPVSEFRPHPLEIDDHEWKTIWHTEVAEALRGKGIGLELVTTAFQYVEENNLQVDVI